MKKSFIKKTITILIKMKNRNITDIYLFNYIKLILS